MKDKLSHLINMGAIHANTGVPFAGAGGAILTNGIQNGTTTSKAPLDANGNSVPSPINQPANPDQSKIVPGQHSTSSNDPTKVQQGGESPLDSYEKLFDNTPEVDENGKVIDNSPPPTILDASPEDFMKAAAKMDFTKNLSEEDIAKVTTDDGKLNAAGLLELIQKVGQNTYASALHTATGITKKGVQLAGDQSNTAAANLVFTNKVEELVLQQNPNLGHKAFEVPMKQIMQQIIKKNPDKTPAEIAKLTVGWFNHAAVQQGNNTPESKEAEAQKRIEDSIEAFWDL